MASRSTARRRRTFGRHQEQTLMTSWIRRIGRAKLTMAITACVVALGAAPASAATLTHWWKADGNANDFVAANNGSLAGDAGFVTGFSGQAFSFDGNGDYVNVPEAASHYPSGSFTVDA